MSLFMADTRNQGSVLDRCHTINISYPDFRILKDNEERLLLPVHNAEDRFQPQALVPDLAVAAHSFRDGVNEVSFFSSVKASSRVRLEEIRESTDDSATRRLTWDIKTTTGYVGHTTLSMATYQVRGSSGQKTEIVRICRTSCYTYRDGDQDDTESMHVHSDSSYDIPLKAFFDLTSTGQLWLQHAKDLLHRRSDRAALHVAKMLSAQDIEDIEETEWKMARYPSYEEVLERYLTRDSIPHASNCSICWENMDLTTERIVTAPCTAHHNFHFDCIRDVARGANPNEVRCPLCRAELFKIEKDLQFLAYGVREGSYVPDDRYDAFENFERSCADIDKCRPDNNDGIITCDRKTYVSIFKFLQEAALTETASSTPYSLQPWRCPEALLFMSAVMSTLKAFDGQQLELKKLYRLLLEHVKTRFITMYLRNLMYVTHSEREVENLRQARSYVITQAMRPGFLEFVERLLSRMLEFKRLRTCECLREGVHYHGEGGRHYINSAFEEPGYGSRPMGL